MPVGAVVGSTIVGVGASAAASSSANKATKTAANAQTQASQDQIQLAREQRDAAQGLMQPYIDQGNRAQAYADALTYGSGTYGGAPAAPQTYAGGGAYDWNAYLQAYPDVAAEAQRMVGLGRFPNVQAYAQHHYETFGSSGGHQPITNAQSHAAQTPEQTVTRADVEQLIQESAPYRIGEEEYAAQEDLGNFTYAVQDGIRQAGLDRRLDTYGEQRDTLTGLEEEARTAFRGVGDENYANTVGLLDEDYLRRQGFTDAEIAAWTDLAEQERDRAIDAAYSRMGVTGQTGRTARTVADETQNYAMQRALYEGGRRRADYEPYSAGRLTADAARGNTYLDAQSAYNANISNINNQYYGQVDNAYTQDTANQQGNVQWRSQNRQQNLSNRTASQQNAYADYQNTLRGQSDRGYSASNAAAGYGQNYASTASNAINNSANAASQSAIARGQNAQNLYGNIAQTVGNAYGAYARQPISQPAAANSYANLPYVQQVGAYTPYQAVRI